VVSVGMVMDIEWIGTRMVGIGVVCVGIGMSLDIFKEGPTKLC